ncbi:MAG: YdhK family protein [Tetragenococcus sp.]|nr:YdhK family protein [Tetragenococcus sp.]
MDHMGPMHHDESGELPAGIQEAKNPKYSVDTTVELLTDHMSDMLHAKAVVDGVYVTTVYSVTYNDTDTRAQVTDHKWVVDEEISYEGSVDVGDQVTILAKHMSGMQSASGTIERIITEPVYMIDYYSSEQDRWVKNHQWVVESEIKAWEE